MSDKSEQDIKKAAADAVKEVEKASGEAAKKLSADVEKAGKAATLKLREEISKYSQGLMEDLKTVHDGGAIHDGDKTMVQKVISNKYMKFIGVPVVISAATYAAVKVFGSNACDMPQTEEDSI